jgi:hypothetical protein
MQRRFEWVVWNRSERRLRAPWRLLLGTIVIGVVSIASILALRPVAEVLGLSWLIAGFGPTIQPLILNAIVGMCIVFGLTGIAWGIDRRNFSDYGLRINREWWVDCGFGLGLGAGAITTVFCIGVAGGWIGVEAVQLTAEAGTLLVVLGAMFVAVGIYEELLVRGYLLTNLAEGIQWFDSVDHRAAAVIATLFSSGVFGGLHATNPNATLLSTGIISAAGVMLAAGYLYTGELAIPIGVHITWNIFQGLVYGFPVSGARLPVSIVRTTSRGSETVSGGAFGPEAGLLGLVGISIAAVGIAVYSRYQHGTLAIDPQITTPELRDSADVAD